MNGRQRGAAFLSWVLIAALISVVALLAARLVPPYVDYRTIVTLIEALPADRVHTMSKLEIRDGLQKRLLINNIRDLKVTDIVDVAKKRDGTIVVLKYEVRQHLAYNVSVVIAFDRSFNYQ
ncbi:MAG: DUF4845 domain-containing protein [Gammaproteobacteria bacterium]